MCKNGGRAWEQIKLVHEIDRDDPSRNSAGGMRPAVRRMDFLAQDFRSQSVQRTSWAVAAT